MSNLFIRLYLDEDVNVLVADLLKARGFDALTVRDAGQLHASDEERFAYAVSQERTLVTHNRTDFEELIRAYFDTGQIHARRDSGCSSFTSRHHAKIISNFESSDSR